MIHNLIISSINKLKDYIHMEPNDLFFYKGYESVGTTTPNHRDQWVELEWTKTCYIPF